MFGYVLLGELPYQAGLALEDHGTLPRPGHRRWHPAGCDRIDAEKLATQHNGRNDQTRSLSFGAYFTR